MSDSKWIKIAADIFDDEKIVLIESFPDAYAIIIVWFKMLCLAGRLANGGVMTIGQTVCDEKIFAVLFRMKEQTIRKALQMFQEFGMITTVDGVITITNWSKHQYIDQSESKREYMRGYMKERRERQKAPTNSTLAGTANSEIKDVNDNRKESATSSTTPRKRFSPPTIDDIKAYCRERQNTVDAERFLAYYDSNGWKVGKNAMKDWKAAVRTWERNGFGNTI